MESNPYIHLSYFHQFHMLRDKPDVAEAYDDWHVRRRELAEEVSAVVRAQQQRLADFDDEIAEFIRVNKLKSKKKPADCDPAHYREAIAAIRAGTYRERDYIDVSKVTKPVPDIQQQLAAAIQRPSLIELINQHRENRS